MPASTIVLIVDRLGSGFLGPYGNTWVQTPALNWLASQATLYEHCVADAADLLSAYRAIWQSRHPAAASGSLELAQVLAEFGPTCLITDEARLVDFPLVEAFDQLIHVPLELPSTAASADTQTCTAKLLYVASEWIAGQNPSTPFLVWIHASALNRCWDAPTAARHQFADEDDPLPPDFVTAPEQPDLGDDPDPDVKLGFAHAYAGEVATLDQAIGDFLSDHEDSLGETRIALGSTRGYPLGEHGQVGGANVLAEVTSVPWIIKSEKFAESCRIQELVQPSQWLSILTNEHQPTQRAISVSEPTQLAFRTPVWSLITSDSQNRLYAKPDDRWDVNDVADVCPEIVEQLEAELDRYKSWLRDPTQELSELDAELLERWE